MLSRSVLRWPASARLLLAPLPTQAPTSTLVLSLRTYATPGRPKSVVGEPSRPVKRRAAGDSTSAAEKKLAASKRKAAVQRKVVELTEEQKLAQQERLEAARAAVKIRQEKKKAATKVRADKEKIAELKTLALEPPARPFSSAYTSYTSEKVRGLGPIPSEHGKSGLGQRMKEVAAMWKTLDPAEIEHYNHIARVKLETAQAEYKKYVERHTPEEIRIANNARKELNRKFPTKYGKQVKYPEIQDERVVTRPRNSYIQFASIRATSGDFKNIMAKDRMKLLGQEWKELSAEEKQKYEELAKQDNLRYVAEFKDTYGHEAPTARAKKTIAAAAA